MEHSSFYLKMLKTFVMTTFLYNATGIYWTLVKDARKNLEKRKFFTLVNYVTN